MTFRLAIVYKITKYWNYLSLSVELCSLCDTIWNFSRFT